MNSMLTSSHHTFSLTLPTHLPQVPDYLVVRCYNVPAGLNSQTLGRAIRTALGKSSAIQHIIPPSKAEIPGVHCYKLVCDHPRTVDALIQMGRLTLPTTGGGPACANQGLFITVRFWRGSKLDLPFASSSSSLSSLTTTTSLSTRPDRPFSFPTNLLGESKKFYWLEGAFTPSGGALGSSRGLLLPHHRSSTTSTNTTSTSTTSSASSTITGETWPLDTPWRDVPEETKRRLCVVFRNKPAEWDRNALEDFFRVEFEGDVNAPIVQSIFMTRQFPKLATIACFNETSRNRLIRLGAFKLPEKWAALNLAKGMADRISVQSWTPPNPQRYNNVGGGGNNTTTTSLLPPPPCSTTDNPDGGGGRVVVGGAPDTPSSTRLAGIDSRNNT